MMKNGGIILSVQEGRNQVNTKIKELDSIRILNLLNKIRKEGTRTTFSRWIYQISFSCVLCVLWIQLPLSLLWHHSGAGLLTMWSLISSVSITRAFVISAQCWTPPSTSGWDTRAGFSNLCSDTFPRWCWCPFKLDNHFPWAPELLGLFTKSMWCLGHLQSGTDNFPSGGANAWNIRTTS